MNQYEYRVWTSQKKDPRKSQKLRNQFENNQSS